MDKLNKTFLKLVVAACSLLIGMSASAYDFMVNHVAYNILTDGNSVEVTYSNYPGEYEGGGGGHNNYAEPMLYVNGWGITDFDGLDDSRYEYLVNYKGITSLTIPKQVSYAGKTYEVTTIGDLAFAGTADLKRISLPSTITTIKEMPFLVSNITEVNVEDLGSWCSLEYEDTNGFSWSRNAFSTEDLYESVDFHYYILANIRTYGSGYYPNHSYSTWYSPTHVSVFRMNGSAINDLKIPSSVSTIRTYDFWGNKDIQSLRIPRNVVHIETHAFDECSNLRSVYVESENPSSIQMDEDVFYGIPLSSCVLYVPEGSAGLYRSANPWKNFGSIQAFNWNDVQATGISLNLSQLQLALGETYTLSATVTPSNATDKSVTWTSSNTSVATVSSSGVVTAKAVGTANITATTADGSNLSATCVVNISGNISGYDFISGGLAYKIKNNSTVEVTSTADIEFIERSDVEYSGGGDPINEDFWWIINGTEYERTDVPEGANYPNLGKNVVIPASVVYSGVTYTVNGISDFAFAFCNLESVTIPSTITHVGAAAFEQCDQLQSVYISDLNKWIRIYFSGSLSHKTYHGHPINELLSWVSIGFSSSGNPTELAHHLYLNGSEFSSVVIPNNITSLRYTFIGCIGLNSVTIPNSVITIGDGTFSGCSNLRNTSIPNSVTSIGNWAFYGCTGLTNMVIPNSVTSIGNYAFQNCSNLSEVRVSEGLASIGSYAFAGTAINSFLLTRSMTEISEGAFSNCNNLPDTLRIPDNIISVGPNAFESSPLRCLYVPATTERLGEFAFYGTGLTDVYTASYTPSCRICEEFYGGIGWEGPPIGNAYAFGDVMNNGTLHVPPGTREDYSNPYYWGYDIYNGWADFSHIEENGYDFKKDGICYYFNRDGQTVTVTYEQKPNDENGGISYPHASGSLTIPPSVTYNGKTYSVTAIGESAFQGCTGFTGSLTIPSSVTTIDESAFWGCSGFTGSLTIPNSVKTIGESAFFGCSGFTGSLNIPDSLTTIGNSTFYGCRGFTGSLTIPKTVTAIGNQAFAGCSGFTAVNNHISHPTKVQLGKMVFSDFDYSACILYVSSNSIDAYRAAEQWKDFINMRRGKWDLDFNGDGVVDQLDYEVLVNHIANNSAYNEIFDFDHNGTIDAVDANIYLDEINQ